jgi:antitoxin CptB
MTAIAPPPDPIVLGKLRWRCRRGMKELDVLLERYVDRGFCGASKPEQDAFKQLLESEDTDLYAFCLGGEKPPARFAALIERITANPPAAADQ